jgi:agmatine deiminase
MTNNIQEENDFIMPAEWGKHSATWLAWPNDDDYFGERISKVKEIYVKIIFALHTDEDIKLLVLNNEVQTEVTNLLKENGVDLSKIIFFQTEYMDVWVRDYGPTFIKNKDKMAWVRWQFSAFNGKFPELLKDGEVFLNLKDKIDFKIKYAAIDMEGGAIEVNGLGTLLTTEQCLIENRNLTITKKNIEKVFSESIGAKNVIWLKKGLLNDHTDGHIDEVARFVSPTKILCGFEDDIQNENYERLKENYQILENAVDQDGKKFEVFKLPMPHMYYEMVDKEHGGKQAPVSYANFYIGNKTVLMSIFNDPNDEKAIEIIKSCFPDREVIGIDCRDLIYGGGALHCITQQEPK